MRIIYILILFYSIVVNIIGQEPVNKIYSTEDGMPSFDNIKAIYTGDSLFLSLSEGKMLYFDGINFYPKVFPKTKCCFLNIAYLKKGEIIISQSKEFWYRQSKGQFKELDSPKRYIVFKNVLYGFFEDGIYYFDEKSISWKAKRIFSDKKLLLKNNFFYIDLDEHKVEELTLKDVKYYIF